MCETEKLVGGDGSVGLWLRQLLAVTPQVSLLTFLVRDISGSTSYRKVHGCLTLGDIDRFVLCGVNTVGVSVSISLSHYASIYYVSCIE
jgi:hypothetical protein